MATQVHITAPDDFVLGSDHQFVFTVTDATGSPQDISGWALSWKLRHVRSSEMAVAQVTKTTPTGITIASPAATVTVLDTDTQSLLPGLYYHELWRTDEGAETPLASGTALLKQGLHG